jgi:hypothetical protein
VTFFPEDPPIPWWKRLLWRVFPFLRPKYEFQTIETLRCDQPNANNDVYSRRGVQELLEREQSMTDMALRDTTFSGVFQMTVEPKGRKHSKEEPN